MGRFRPKDYLAGLNTSGRFYELYECLYRQMAGFCWSEPEVMVRVRGVIRGQDRRIPFWVGSSRSYKYRAPYERL